MRWARFMNGDSPAFAIVEEEHLLPVRGSPFESWERTGRRVALADARLLVPVVPQTFYACGMNYVEHVKAYTQTATSSSSSAVPTRPEVGYRANNALIAHGEPIVIPRDATEHVQYEGELVVVIGKRAKNLTEADALSCVFGYTIGNDVSERSWQKSDRTFWRSKNTDTFKPMGPWIETDVDLNTLKTSVFVNGERHIEFPTNHMLFGVAKFIATMTQYLTLHPGDVIWMGTEGSPRNIAAGDVVEVTITGIGTLRNPVWREA